MKYSRLVIPVLAVAMLCGACSSTKDSKKSESKPAETSAHETTRYVSGEEEFSAEDIEPVDGFSASGRCVSIDDTEAFKPDQNIEIDTDYMKFYDYDRFYSDEPADEVIPCTTDDLKGITDEILKTDALALIEDGFTVLTADDNAVWLSGLGLIEEDTGMGIAYLYRGFEAYKETDNLCISKEEYIVSQEVLDTLPLVKSEEKDGKIIYKADPTQVCPDEFDYVYDPQTQLLTHETSAEIVAGAVG